MRSLPLARRRARGPLGEEKYVASTKEQNRCNDNECLVRAGVRETGSQWCSRARYCLPAIYGTGQTH